ncbi:MAG: hypothetical protein ABIJ59_10960 [Pseudomonadota bacterium]
MSPRYLIVFLVCFHIFSISSKPVAAQEADRSLWTLNNQSSIRVNRNNEAIIENHTYLSEKCFRYNSDDKDRFVVSQKSVWHKGDWEGNNPYIEATGFIIDPNGVEKKLWTISEKADDGFLSCDFYRTVWYGCCSAGPNNRLYNLKTGILVNEYNVDLLTIEIPNTPIKRYIGYKPAETIHHYLWENNEHHIGTLTYSSSSKLLHRIVIRGRGSNYKDKFSSGFAKLSLIPGEKNQKLNGSHAIDLWGANNKNNSKLVTDFKINLEFYDISFQIEIKEDDFFLTQTVFPNYEIIREKK